MKKIFILIILLISCDSDSKSKSDFDKGTDLFKAGSYVEALEKFEAYYEKNPNKKTESTLTAINWAKLKLVKSNSSYLNNARSGFSDVLDDYPDNEDAKYGFSLASFSIKSNLSTIDNYLDDILSDSEYSFSLNDEVDAKHILLLQAELFYYQNNYTDALTSLNAIYSKLGESNSLTASDSDFIFKLSQAIEAMLERLN